MQIFFLKIDTTRNAHSYYDEHVGRVLFEITQMACGLFQEKGVVAPYKIPEKELKGSQFEWFKSSPRNMGYTINLGFALANEFKKRYKNEHGAYSVLKWASENLKHVGIKPDMNSPFPETPPLFIEEKFIVKLDEQNISKPSRKELRDVFGKNYLEFSNSILSYRECYYHKKGYSANWKHGKRPSWYKEHKSSCLLQ